MQREPADAPRELPAALRQAEHGPGLAAPERRMEPERQAHLAGARMWTSGKATGCAGRATRR